ncbi:MAG: ABC transporter permease [Peptococcaceae bacterium]|nr:MAG: ABC transporter permease [Peptococcaceae bacterium]
MKLNIVGYYFREAVQSIWRNSWLSMASIGVVAVSLFILGSSLLLVLNVNSMVGALESRVEINVFIKDKTTPAQIKEMEEEFRSMPDISEVRFISKTQALEEMKEKFGDKKEILSGLEEKNPLPDTFRIKTASIEMVQPLARQIEGLPQVDQVRYGQNVVEKLAAFGRWVRLAGLVAMILFAVAAVFLIATTTRLSVYARRREIGIMKYLGATNWFVRGPFLLEGMLLGFLGSVLAVMVIYFGYFSLIGTIKISLLFMLTVTDPGLILPILESLVALGLIIGAAGSAISMRKFLMV